MVDTMEVREHLESLAASLAAQTMTEEQRVELERIANEYAEAIRNNNMEDMIHYDELFHKGIVNASGNKTLIQISESVQELALRFRYLYYDDLSRYGSMPMEHKEILDAIENNDPQAAKECAKNHVKRLKDFVIREGETAFRHE